MHNVVEFVVRFEEVEREVKAHERGDRPFMGDKGGIVP